MDILLFVTTAGVAVLATTSGVIRSNKDDNNNKKKINNKYYDDDDKKEPDWDTFTFSLNGVQTDLMWYERIVADGNSNNNQYTINDEMNLIPLSNNCIQLHPASTILNYGQGLFEGIKAFRRKHDGKIVIFRPNMNGKRMYDGAVRFLLPPVPINVFVHAVTAVVKANIHWIPPIGKGALYIRPLLLGTGAGLGVKPSTECTFCIYTSPVGNYFKGSLKSIRLQAVKGCPRAVIGGSGCIKAIGNYAPAFTIQSQVRQRGYDEALFLDAITNEAIEEAGASNFFAIFANSNTIVTPSLENETILPGVTRASILVLAEKECNMIVETRRLTLQELRNNYATEAFCCGTGASITPVQSISIVDKTDPTIEIENEIIFTPSPGPITVKLYNMLLDIQMGNDEVLCNKYSEWIHIVET